MGRVLSVRMSLKTSSQHNIQAAPFAVKSRHYLSMIDGILLKGSLA